MAGASAPPPLVQGVWAKHTALAVQPCALVHHLRHTSSGSSSSIALHGGLTDLYYPPSPPLLGTPPTPRIDCRFNIGLRM